MKCCVEGCKRHPSKGDLFSRVNAKGEPGKWVCQEHFDKVEFSPGVKETHLRFREFFGKEK